MPLYDYQCEGCGPFTAFASLDHFNAPCECPECAASAPRVLRHAPRLAVMSGGTRRAHETNERSADSPKRSSHGPGCSCCSASSARPSKTLHHANGAKSFPAKRPWMISH
ncbi:zinc ribbon domain-containing protein [Roseobacter sp. YSTF-M11]|uniref:Zinc ribbon domain-containing protein n=2 Tax=Roseobacter insulae TaxID=2859783 RepID=A0A9X1FUU0_9RHOB|nr:zinc ribbon domain-containing protein [Roseobacter insulae]